MQHSENKSLVEYGDLQSEHHTSVHERQASAEAQRKIEDEAPKLVLGEGPGGMYTIVWTKGKQPIPANCEGLWNHAGKATDAMKAANRKLADEARATAVKAVKDAEPKFTGKPVAVKSAPKTKSAKRVVKEDMNPASTAL